MVSNIIPPKTGSLQKMGLCSITVYQHTGKILEYVHVLGLRGAHWEISFELVRQHGIHAIQTYLC